MRWARLFGPPATRIVLLFPELTLLARGQEAVEARCLAATRAMAGPSGNAPRLRAPAVNASIRQVNMATRAGKIALETLLATTKYQLQATGEFAMPEPLLQDVSQKLWVKTDCGDPEKLARHLPILSPPPLSPFALPFSLPPVA